MYMHVFGAVCNVSDPKSGQIQHIGDLLLLISQTSTACDSLGVDRVDDVLVKQIGRCFQPKAIES